MFSSFEKVEKEITFFFFIVLLQEPLLEAFIYITIIDHYKNFGKFNKKTHFFCGTQYTPKN